MRNPSDDKIEAEVSQFSVTLCRYIGGFPQNRPITNDHRMTSDLQVYNYYFMQQPVKPSFSRFKPLDVVQVMKPLYTSFELLFQESFSVSKNANFLRKVQVQIVVPHKKCC